MKLQPFRHELFFLLFEKSESFDLAPETKLIFLRMIKATMEDAQGVRDGICWAASPRVLWRLVFHEKDFEVCHEKGLAAHRELEKAGYIEEIDVKDWRWLFQIKGWDAIRDSLDTHRAAARAASARRKESKK